ncbi:MAG: hypothetical protein K2X47_06000, partial [Bdellovibrionales bacterium]|nr:hypothetical protein [Bdellovibrionales bacterium]
MFLKSKILCLIASALTLFQVTVVQGDDKCTKPWVFFDLGQTIVDTDTNKYNPMFYMPNAYEYVQSLNKLGHKTGMIIDIPEQWGRDTAELKAIKDLATAKWIRILKFLAGEIPADETSWKGRAFELRHFGAFTGLGPKGQLQPSTKFEGQVVVPMKDSERKDTGNPIVFVRALALADKASCEAVYMSE